MTCLNNHPRLLRLHQHLMPYYDVIIFIVTLFLANSVWKLTIHGDEEGVGMVTWLGLNITPFFDYLAEQTANAVFWLVSLVRDTIYQVDAITLRFLSGSGSRIVWSCTPLKQSFIWLCLMLTTPAVAWANNDNNDNDIRTVGNRNDTVRKSKVRARWHKLWYIPLGWLLIYFFNILRISAILLFIEFHPDWFDILHTYIFKYLFYGMMFLLWIIYVEKIRLVVSAD